MKQLITENFGNQQQYYFTGKSETLNDNKNITSISQNITKGLNLHIKFENEESCKKIKENFANENVSFETVSKKDVLNLMKELPGNRVTVSNDIPVSLLKESISAYYEKLSDIFNNCLRSCTFPGILKGNNEKKGNPTSKTDFRPVNGLSKDSFICN